MENAHIMLKRLQNAQIIIPIPLPQHQHTFAQIMLKSKDYAFPFGLCFLRQIMLKIMQA